MNIQFKHCASAIVIALFGIMAVASTPSKETISSKPEQFPPDLKGYNGAIIIIESTKDWTKYAKKYFEEYYSGDVIVIPETEVFNYTDVEKYRFVIRRKQEIFYDGFNKRYFKENICTTDRKAGYQYCTDFNTSMYGKLLKTYAQAFQDAR
ncbi:MAG TPA: hypothetical protein PKM63_22195 [Panacibacter sp.]|nr:hypothetical protein [Panacibacter sp.]HNP47025.1 hypothetical protein [Panacibacter sp.]